MPRHPAEAAEWELAPGYAALAFPRNHRPAINVAEGGPAWAAVSARTPFSANSLIEPLERANGGYERNSTARGFGHHQRHPQSPLVIAAQPKSRSTACRNELAN